MLTLIKFLILTVAAVAAKAFKAEPADDRQGGEERTEGIVKRET